VIRVPVDSSSLASVGYDVDNFILEVEFRNGKIYQYLGVPLAIHQKMMSADSLGQFLNKYVKPAYECNRL
jgi:hypothetical protein